MPERNTAETTTDRSVWTQWTDTLRELYRRYTEPGGRASLYRLLTRRTVIKNILVQEKYGEAFDDVKILFLTLETPRFERLLDDYTEQYGKGARHYAQKTYTRWQSGDVQMAGQTVARLLDLLPRHMQPDEKLTVIKHLREQALRRLTRSRVRLAVSRRSDMTVVLQHLLRLMQRASEIEMPTDFQEVQGWISQEDTQALILLIQETERFVATQRLADLMVQMSTIARLAPLAASGLQVFVTTYFEIPTASIEIRFTHAFWKEEKHEMGQEQTENQGDAGDQDFLVHLQELALRQEHQDGSLSFVEYVMRSLTTEEQEKLRAIAATEGLRTEILLRELQVKTIAARGDIEATIATAEQLKERKHASRITSEHITASGTTRIEIVNKPRPCYIATACYGDADHPDVQTFRQYRDEKMLPSAGGRFWARLYDVLSPPLAHKLGKVKFVSQALRVRVLAPWAQRLRSLDERSD